MYLRDNIKIMVQELSKGWFEVNQHFQSWLWSRDISEWMLRNAIIFFQPFLLIKEENYPKFYDEVVLRVLHVCYYSNLMEWTDTEPTIEWTLYENHRLNHWLNYKSHQNWYSFLAISGAFHLTILSKHKVGSLQHLWSYIYTRLDYFTTELVFNSTHIYWQYVWPKFLLPR